MKKLSTLIIISLCFITNSFANHVAGGNINFKHLGNKRYEIELIIIRDCNGTQLSNLPVNVWCSGGSFNTTLPLISIKDVTGIGELCTISSKCAGSYNYGFEEAVYKGIIDLSSLNCCEVTLSWKQASRPRRSVFFNNYYNFYIEGVVNICAGASMVWDKIPSKKLIHVGRDEMLNYSIGEVDGNDSVSYELVRPSSDRGVSINYSGHYDFYRPISFLGFPNTNLNFPAGFHFDETNGNLKFRPTIINQSTQIAVKATAWRRINGIMTKVATIITDHPLIVIDQTFVSNPVQKANDVFNTCLGDTSVAIIEVKDVYTKGSYTVNLNHKLKWATANFVASNNSKYIVVRFLADSIKTIDKTNAITIEIKDDRCPLPGKSIRSYGISADSTITKFSDSSSLSKSSTCNVVTFYHQNKSSNPDIEYYWNITQANDSKTSVGDSVVYIAKDTGWVKGALIAFSKKHCNAFVYTDSVYISSNNLVKVSASGGTTCNSLPYNITALVSQGTAPFTYLWSTNQTGKTIGLNVSKGDNIYEVIVTDSNGCKNSDTLRVINYHPSISIIGDSLTCKGGKVNLEADIKDTTSTPNYSWSGLPQQQTQLVDSITVPKTYTFTINDGICTSTKSIEVKISQPFATFSHQPSTCSGTPIQITAMPQGGRAPYSVFWDSYQKTGNTISVSTKNAKLGTSPYVATVTDALGCTGLKVASFEILPTPVVSIVQPSPLCEDNSSYGLLTLATPQGGIWQGAGVNSNNFYASQTGAGISELKYSFTNSDGCSDSVTTFIKVYAKPTISFISDSTEIFKGSKVSFTNTTIADTTYRSWWNFGDSGKSGNRYFGEKGSYTYNDTGKYTVKLRVDNGICSIDSILKLEYITVKEQPKNPNISVREINENSLTLYPNPAKDKLTIEADNLLAKIVLVDVLGKRYEIKKTILLTNKVTLNTENLPTGVYVVEAKLVNGSTLNTKIIIE